MPTSISRDELRTAIDDGSVVVLDTLGGSYYDRQHLPGALPLTLDAITSLDDARRFVPELDAPVVTYCSNPACQNSTQVARRLEALGYTSVRKYTDGIEDWVAAGLPVETGSHGAGDEAGRAVR
jgi:rhodanese-related sulfurtransferase